MKLDFDKKATKSDNVTSSVNEFLSEVSTLELGYSAPIIIFQDGVDGSYYIKCSLLAEDASRLCDLNAKLLEESFRANRRLMKSTNTYLRMKDDASKGREFNDIIVEFNKTYEPNKPLKVWGGQHRISAIQEAGAQNGRYHGFRIYFNLSKKQRAEVAFISNTNISLSNDTFDRMIEETEFGNTLLKWCQSVGLLEEGEDFPDVGSRSEKITVRLARSFVVNYYLGLKRAKEIDTGNLDANIYEPSLIKTGYVVDPNYKEVMEQHDLLKDKNLLDGGKNFLLLHNTQYQAVKKAKSITSDDNRTYDRKSYRNKALIESIVCGWSYVAGLLQSYPDRLKNHYKLPRTSKDIPDPLNGRGMSQYHYDKDDPSYRGLATRTTPKDRQRVAHLFLAKSSIDENVILDEAFIDQAVYHLEGLLNYSKGYMAKRK